VIENPRRGIANLLHRQPHAACDLVDAFGAAHVCGLAHARNGGQRSFEHPNDLAERDFVGPTSKKVTAAFTFLALDDSVPLQLEQDGFQEFLWYRVAFGEIGDQYRSRSCFFSENQQRFQSVLGFAR